MSLAGTGFLSPRAQLRSVVASGLVGFFQADDLIWAEFSSDGARRILAQENAESLWSSTGVTTKNAQGTVKSWLKDGHLVRFEVHLKGLVSTRGPGTMTIPQNYTRITTFAEHGTAEFSIDEEAREALDQPAAAEARRTAAVPTRKNRF